MLNLCFILVILVKLSCPRSRAPCSPQDLLLPTCNATLFLGELRILSDGEVRRIFSGGLCESLFDLGKYYCDSMINEQTSTTSTVVPRYCH